MNETPIQKFYSGKTIFMTGGTGFLGKSLTEKLLRSCPNIEKIYILLRPWRNQNFDIRKQEYFNNELFDTIKQNNIKVIEKVEFIHGDVAKPNLGIDSEIYEKLIKSINIIFHIAATLKFTAPLHLSVPVNISSVQHVIKMAKETVNLQALVHVSSAFSHIVMDVVDENIHSNISYSPNFLMQLVENVDKETLMKMTPCLLGKWPNTYLLTKHAAECYLDAEKENLPVAVYRPGAVISTYSEPIPGWTDNFNTLMGLSIGVALGLIRIVNSKPNCILPMIPVDMTVNCMIAIGWNIQNDKEKAMKVYNYTSHSNPLSMKTFLDYCISSSFALENAIWYPGCIIVQMPNWLNKFYLNTVMPLFAKTADTIFSIFQQNTRYSAMCLRYYKLMDVLSYFLQNFNWKDDNACLLWNKLEPDDQHLFNFDVNSINWNHYSEIFSTGIKRILLKENVRDLKKALSKRKRLFIMHYSLLFFVIICISFLLTRILF